MDGEGGADRECGKDGGGTGRDGPMGGRLAGVIRVVVRERGNFVPWSAVKPHCAVAPLIPIPHYCRHISCQYNVD